MGIKTNGAEYKAYLAETDPKWWPEGAFMEETLLIVNGKQVGDDNFDFIPEKLDDADEVVIEYGAYFKSAKDTNPISLTTHFKNWRKAQTTVRIAVEVHKDKLESLKAVIKANGGKVA